MSATHTPGPWKITREHKSPVSIESATMNDGAALAKVYVTDPKSRRRTTEFAGNARLIAAAPDMLAELKSGIEAARAVVKNWSEGDLAGAVNALEDWAEGCESIAKAKGRT